MNRSRGGTPDWSKMTTRLVSSEASAMPLMFNRAPGPENGE
ncbi:MAG TPA: hypothetical protein PLQ95_08990 [Thiobacillus sp.]|nr:hypothetical protein [Thiobacillus sp.]